MRRIDFSVCQHWIRHWFQQQFSFSWIVSLVTWNSMEITLSFRKRKVKIVASATISNWQWLRISFKTIRILVWKCVTKFMKELKIGMEKKEIYGKNSQIAQDTVRPNQEIKNRKSWRNPKELIYQSLLSGKTRPSLMLMIACVVHSKQQQQQQQHYGVSHWWMHKCMCVCVRIYLARDDERGWQHIYNECSFVLSLSKRVRL